MKIGRWFGLVLACLAVLGITGYMTLCGQTAAPYDSIIVNFVNTVTPTQVAAIEREFGIDLQLNSHSFFARTEKIYQFHYAPEDSGQARRLKRALTQDPLIEYAEPNYQVSTMLTPNDEMYRQQWNLEAINMPAAWDVTAGEGVTVAVIDTGVTRVSDLAETAFVPGFDFVDDDEDATDLHGHGTHVAGTIAQSTNNGIGVAGVAFKAKIMPIRVLDANGFGNVADIAEGIRFAADHGATVINMSLGGRSAAATMQDAVTYAHDKGVTIVAAAGNDGSSGSSYPARYEHVIGVSAVGPSGDKAPYSNFGIGVDIAAPGGAKTQEHPEWGILQQTLNRRNPRESTFEYYQGTSMASPHVAGVAALIQSQGVTAPDEVEKILKLSAQAVPNDKQNYFGSGRLDAQAAVVRSATTDQAENPLMLWLKDFVNYLVTNGYLNPRFWFDGGAFALVPKLIMVLGGYLITLLIRWWMAPKGFRLTMPLWAGMILGSSGLFVLQGLAVVGLPRWPLQMAGSSLPELGTALSQSADLNPIFASVLIPTAAVILLLGHRSLRWGAIGLCAGVASHLLLSGSVFYEGVLWFGSGDVWGRCFLLLNGLLCLWLASLALKASTSSESSSLNLR
jgi:serine protease